MHHATFWTIAISLTLFSIGCKRQGDVSKDDTDVSDTETGEEETFPQPAMGITLSGIEVNQAIGTLIWDDGAIVAESQRTVPLIAGRDAILRLLWDLEPSFESREITAIVTLQSGEESTIYTDTQRITDVSDRDTLSGTWNLSLLGKDIQGDTSVSIELQEQLGRAGANDVNNTPAIDLLAWDDEMALKIHAFSCWMPCVTSSLGTTGDPFTPSSTQKQSTENYLTNLYPVQTLEMTWNPDPLKIDACTSTGALDALQDVRGQDGAGPEEYYHCIFPQAYDSLLAGGFAWILSDELNEPRVSFSVNWWGPEEEMLTNVAHELGHNHGRNHPWSDSNWQPAAANETGCRSTWGLGIRPGPFPTEYWHPALKDPSSIVMPPSPNLQSCEHSAEHPTPPTTGDVMSYTVPQWVDAYTYKAFAERIRAVSLFSSSAARENWTQNRTLFATQTQAGLRWSWGYGGAEPSQHARTNHYAEITTSLGTQHRVPLKARVGSDGIVYGFSLTLPDSSQVHSSKGRTKWRGQITTHFQGQTHTLDLADLALH